MSEHPIGDMMSQTMQKIHDLVEANTIIGTPITTPDGVMLIPVSKMVVGFGCGGSDYKGKGEQAAPAAPIMFGGGSGAGVTVTPVAFIVVSGTSVRLLPVAGPANTTVDRIIDLVPEMVEKISGFVGKNQKSAETEETL